MNYFWKLGIIGTVFTLLNTGIAVAQSSQVNYERYNLPYESYSPELSYTPITVHDTVSKKTVKKKSVTSTHNTAATANPSHIVYSKKIIEETRNAPPFSSIDIDGPFRVNIKSGDGHQKIILKGNVNAVPLVTSRVIGNTLVVRMLPSKTGKLNPPYDPRVTIQIDMPRELLVITAAGNTHIMGEGVYSSHLMVKANGHSSLYLRGRITVHEIVSYTTGDIDIDVGHVQGIGVWGNGSGLICIIGRANVMTAAIGGLQRLDASHLRTGKVYIETWGGAVAQVLPVVTLYAFARDNSSIYYYKKPQIIAGNSQQSGNILRLGNRP